jgi:hypothetical protein
MKCMYRNRTVPVSETTVACCVPFINSCKSQSLGSGTWLHLPYPYFLSFSYDYITGYLYTGCFYKNIFCYGRQGY